MIEKDNLKLNGKIQRNVLSKKNNQLNRPIIKKPYKFNSPIDDNDSDISSSLNSSSSSETSSSSSSQSSSSSSSQSSQSQSLSSPLSSLQLQFPPHLLSFPQLIYNYAEDYDHAVPNFIFDMIFMIAERMLIFFQFSRHKVQSICAGAITNCIDCYKIAGPIFCSARVLRDCKDLTKYPYPQSIMEPEIQAEIEQQSIMNEFIEMEFERRRKIKQQFKYLKQDQQLIQNYYDKYHEFDNNNNNNNIQSQKNKEQIETQIIKQLKSLNISRQPQQQNKEKKQKHPNFSWNVSPPFNMNEMRPMYYKSLRNSICDYCEVQTETVRNIERAIFQDRQEYWVPFWFRWKKESKIRNPIVLRERSQNQKGGIKIDDDQSDGSSFALDKDQTVQKSSKKPKNIK